MRLLAQNPAEKKLVFVHDRDSLAHVAGRLGREGTPFATMCPCYCARSPAAKGATCSSATRW